eukprot:gnl/Spiro4/6124_TR3150_c0_g1_i1.p1 gnl/Spiro4/6124_TR3150_c0_g1~~gnl/Spiro4/6124_TR3150_c0_g1_i1.p1  ORF type:complete len:749 (+),score=251.92 gnl/Spiro4/6124_TR3150_c0_g1_i1:62-2248(+)
MTLPLSRVVLYKHGMSNFERRGVVSGDATVNFFFKSNEMNDVLKSLTVMDLSGHGAIASISYDNDKPTERRLSEGAIRINGNNSFTGFVAASRGSLVRVVRRAEDNSTAEIEGLVLGTDKSSTSAPSMQILCQDNTFHSILLSNVLTIQIVDQSLKKDFVDHMAVLKTASHKDLKQLTIFATGDGERTIQVSYTMESPMWKASYRLILQQSEAPAAATGTETDESRQRCHIQGWAIVDNITNEKWDNVELVLVSGEPHSYEHDLFTPRYKRARKPLSTDAAADPDPFGVSSSNFAFGSSGTFPPPPQQMPFGMGGMASNYMPMNSLPPQMMQQIPQMPQQMMSNSFPMQQMMPQQTMSNSFPVQQPMSMQQVMQQVQAQGMEVDGAQTAVAASAPTSAEEVGDLFKYTISHPVTVRANQSALVPIVEQDTSGARVAVWNPERHKNAHPNSAVLFSNTTGLTLEQGPVAILEGSTYVGEAILPTVQPGETKFVEFSTERAVELWKTETSRSQVFRSRIAAGVMIQTSHRTHVTKYNIRSKATRNITLYIEHRFKKGTTLVSEAKPTNPKPIQFYIFKTKAEADKQTEFVVEEQQEEETRVELSGQCSHRSIKAWLSEHVIDQETKRVLDRYCDLISTSNTHGSSSRKKRDQLRQIEQKQGRIRENLKAMGRSNQEVSLREKYVRELEADEDAISALENEIVTEETERDRVAEQAQALLRSITFTTEVRH